MDTTTDVKALSDREKQVLALIARGRTNAEIADELEIRFDTAKWHVSEILSKLGVDSREEAAQYWRAYNSPRVRLARAVRALIPAAGWLKIGGAVVAVAAASAAVFVFFVLKGSDGNEPAMVSAPAATASPTPASPNPAIDAVRQRLEREGAATNVVDAGVAGDIDKLVAQLQVSSAVCRPSTDHGEPPLCGPLGLPPGTPVEVAMVGSAVLVPVPQQALREFFATALASKQGRLVFVGKTSEAIIVGIGFPAVSPPLPGLVSAPYSTFMFEVKTAAPVSPISRTVIVLSGSEPKTSFTEAFGGPDSEIWYSE